MDFLLDQNLAQKIADYLTGQPYREVVVLLNQLSQLKPAPTDKEV